MYARDPQTVYFWCVTHYNDPAIIALSPWVSLEPILPEVPWADPVNPQSFTAEPVLTSIMAAVSLPSPLFVALTAFLTHRRIRERQNRSSTYSTPTESSLSLKTTGLAFPSSA